VAGPNASDGAATVQERAAAEMEMGMLEKFHHPHVVKHHASFQV
jgi:hypothetical protein